MVNVMVSAIVAKEQMEEVPWKPQSTMIVDGLEGGKGEEEDGSSGCHAREEERKDPTDSVQDQALQRVVVKCPKGIGDYQAVVLRVDMLVQELVDVHVSMHEVLPCVNDHHSNHELAKYYQERWLGLNDSASIIDYREQDKGNGDLKGLLHQNAFNNGALGRNVLRILLGFSV